MNCLISKILLVFVLLKSLSFVFSLPEQNTWTVVLSRVSVIRLLFAV